MEEKNGSEILLRERENIESINEDSEEIIKSPDHDCDKDLEMRIGTYEEAPKYFQDNEFIKGGYLLNANTFKKIFKSFFSLHNCYFCCFCTCILNP